MKIMIFTDTHIGARSGSKIFREMFKEYYNNVVFPYIKKHGITDVLHLGDFFDDRNKISLHDIDYIKTDYIPNFQATGATMHILAGNHDVAFRNTNAINSLSIFKGVDGFKIYDEEIEVLDFDGVKFVMCPWVNNTNHDGFMETLKHYANKNHILCGHFEIEGALMYKGSTVCERGLDPKIFSKFLKVLSGHFHHPSKYGNIEYIGALFHYTWQCYNDWRGFQVWDLENGDIELIENKDTLFTQIEYTDDIKIDDYSVFKGQITRVLIKQEFETVKLKEFITNIEKENPASLDVINYTILETEELDEVEIDENATVKEVVHYFEEALESNPNKVAIMSLMDELYTDARSKMMEFE